MASFLASPLAGVVAVAGVYVASIYLVGGSFATFGLVIALYAHFYLFEWHKKANEVSINEVGTAKPGEGAVRRKPGVKELATSPYPGVTTLYENFQRGVEKFGDNNCLGTRTFEKNGTRGAYKWETYKQVGKRIKNFGAGLLGLYDLPIGARVGFYSKNCAEWVIGAEACNAYSLVNVALYDTLGEENRVFIVQQAEILVIVTTPDLVKNVAALAKECPTLKAVVVIGELNKEQQALAADAGLEVHSFAEVEKSGETKPVDLRLPTDDLAILMYTSGTTSTPKGVLVTHTNLVSAVAGVLQSVMPITSDDVLLSYLPLAHIFERASEAAMFCSGASVGFYQGDVRKLDDDIRTLAPTLFVGVPKVYQRVMLGIQKKVALSGPIARFVFYTAFAIQQKAIESGFTIGLLNKIVFAKVQEGLGGRVRQALAGGAPLSAECHQFIRICFGCPFMQGYGLTETSGGTTVTPYDMPNPYGRAGIPISSTEVKLVDAGNYKTSGNPPRGEVCVSGPCVTKGYYKMEEKTKEDFREEEDGRIWFHTGDVGQWNEDGSLSIIGRTKDIFKLDGGEYIAPERLETIFASCKYVGNIFVYGDSTKSFIVAIIVPEPIAAKHWATEQGLKYNDEDFTATSVPDDLCENAQFKKAIIDDLAKVASTAKLNRFEFVTVLHLSAHMWTPESGLVTAALKNKRPVLQQAFQSQIDSLYA
jgi:long-chain acyl-CoA synthetase